ncbi:MAG: hypothetical protein RSE58_10575 [Clostridia bacterium]
MIVPTPKPSKKRLTPFGLWMIVLCFLLAFGVFLLVLGLLNPLISYPMPYSPYTLVI